MAIKRSCYLCGAKYEFCDCNRQPAYMATFCSENCRDIFKSLCSYGSGMISAEECKELLECCDLSNQDSYKESTRNAIAKVLGSDKPVVEPIEEVIPEPIVESEPIKVIEQIPEYNFGRKNKKRNHEVVLDE